MAILDEVLEGQPPPAELLATDTTSLMLASTSATSEHASLLRGWVNKGKNGGFELLVQAPWRSAGRQWQLVLPEVGEGLARLGHELLIVVARREGQPQHPVDVGVTRLAVELDGPKWGVVGTAVPMMNSLISRDASRVLSGLCGAMRS